MPDLQRAIEPKQSLTALGLTGMQDEPVCVMLANSGSAGVSKWGVTPPGALSAAIGVCSV